VLFGTSQFFGLFQIGPVAIRLQTDGENGKIEWAPPNSFAVWFWPTGSLNLVFLNGSYPVLDAIVRPEVPTARETLGDAIEPQGMSLLRKSGFGHKGLKAVISLNIR